MTSTVLFLIIAVITGILLIVSCITATISAADSFGSSFYNSDPLTRSAHQYLTVASALFWAALIVMIIILIVAIFAGLFAPITVSDDLLLKRDPTVSEITSVKQATQILIGTRTTQLIVLIILVLVGLTIFIAAILSAIGAANLGEMNQQDADSRSAYTTSITAAIVGLITGVMMFGLVLIYSRIRAERDEEVGKLTLFTEQNEIQVLATPAPAVATTA